MTAIKTANYFLKKLKTAALWRSISLGKPKKIESGFLCYYIKVVILINLFSIIHNAFLVTFLFGAPLFSFVWAGLFFVI